MPHWQKFATSFAEISCYFFVTFAHLSKLAASADNLSYDGIHLVGPCSVRVPDQR